MIVAIGGVGICSAFEVDLIISVILFEIHDIRGKLESMSEKLLLI